MKGRKLTHKEKIEKIEADKGERRKVFNDLCKHLSKGYSLECFSLLSANSIRKYLETYPEEFVQEEINDALREGQIYWEGIGRRQADGTCLGNSRTWYYNMSNRYRWSDRQQIETEHKGSVAVTVVNYASQKSS